MSTVIDISGIILLGAIGIWMIVALVATVIQWFDIVRRYWKHNRAYKRCVRKMDIRKLYAAACCLYHYRWTYPETQGMTVGKLEEFYRKQYVKETEQLNDKKS